MKKIAFIIPYFGRFNHYFQHFLNSCSYNKDFVWLLFTDDLRDFSYPNNVEVFYMTFETMQEMVRSKFDIPVSIEYPYKLCDYKPAYGFIFEEYLRDFLFWGYCDTDLVFGNMAKFITDEDLEEYDKIGFLGHCTIIRNTLEINLLFMKPLNGNLRYKEVYLENWNHSFDEEYGYSINNIFEEYGYRVRKKEYEANIFTKSSDFKIIRYDFDTSQYTVEKKKKAVFIFQKGSLNRYEENKGNIKKTEYFYIHMQSRPMRIKIQENSDYYKIIPNAFDTVEENSHPEKSIRDIRLKYLNLHYFKLRGKNLIDKIKKKLSAGKTDR